MPARPTRHPEVEVRHALIRRRKRLQRTYLFQIGPIIMLALLLLIVSASHFLEPITVGGALKNAAPFDSYWNGTYLVGSLLILYGLFSRRLAFEIIGNLALVPAFVLQFVIAAPMVGLHRITLLAFIFAIGFALRALGLYLGWQDDDHA